VFAVDRFDSCGAEATHVEIRRGGGSIPDEDYAFLACAVHASKTAEEIGMKFVPELRDDLRFREVEAAF
jgi:hypothetical protein